jgi:nucleoside-diphosphate-sugar epimerase
MIRAYEKLITSPKSLINKQIFNVGWDNKSVFEIAQTVKKLLGEDIKIKITETNDNRSYHISSQKIKSFLGFEAKFNIEQAIIDLKEAFKNNKLKNTLRNIEYFNIKKMQSIKLE